MSSNKRISLIMALLGLMVSAHQAFSIENFAQFDDQEPIPDFEARKLNSGGPIGNLFRELREIEFYYRKFQHFDSIEDRLMRINTISSSGPVSMVLRNLNSTYEGNPLYLVKLSERASMSRKKPIIFIDAGHYARDWLAYSTAMYLIESFVRPRMPRDGLLLVEKSSRLQNLLELYDFWFVPVVNPDGYIYSQSGPQARAWYMNRNLPKLRFPFVRQPDCLGTNIARNYEQFFEPSERLTGDCFGDRSNEAPNREQETIAISKLLMENSDRIKMYITLHNNGTSIMYPNFGSRLGWISSEPDPISPEAEKALSFVASAGAKAIKSVRGTYYNWGRAGLLLGDLMWPGFQTDFAYHKANISYSFAMNLEGASWDVNPSEIIPVAYQTGVGIAAMIRRLP